MKQNGIEDNMYFCYKLNKKVISTKNINFICLKIINIRSD